jgi:hypothetical protein
MTFAVAAGYWIVICTATAAAMRLSSAARPPVVARSSARRCRSEGRSVQTGYFRRKDVG